MDLNKAQIWIQRYYDGRPLNNEDLLQIGEAFLVIEDPKNAEKVYEKIGEKVPLDPLIRAGKLQLTQNHYQIARDCYKVAINNLEHNDVVNFSKLSRELQEFKQIEVSRGIKHDYELDNLVKELEEKIDR